MPRKRKTTADAPKNLFDHIRSLRQPTAAEVAAVEAQAKHEPELPKLPSDMTDEERAADHAARVQQAYFEMITGRPERAVSIRYSAEHGFDRSTLSTNTDVHYSDGNGFVRRSRGGKGGSGPCGSGFAS